MASEARCRLLDTLVAELSGVDGERVALAASEELAIARELGDPRLLAMALESSAKCRSHELHRDERERLGSELRTLAFDCDLPHYLWTCEFVDSCVAGARNDPVALRRHAEAGAALAARYQLSEPEVVNLAALAMLAHIRGDFDEAAAVRRTAEVAPDKLFTVHGTVRGELIVELGLREQAPDMIRRLLPFQDQIAGASTLAHAVHPVALTLGRLYRLLGDEATAVRQFAQAEEVALRWDAAHWAAEARRELERGAGGTVRDLGEASHTE
jgi:hypothetical protein